MDQFDRRLTFQKLEVFCLVVELGGVHQAATRLFVSQPVVSAHLKSLQRFVGSPLFERDGRRLVLTKAGELFHAWVTETMRRERTLARELENLAKGIAGTVVFSTGMSLGNYVLPPTVVRFARERPDARLTMVISDPDAALRRTESGDSDYCIIMADEALDPKIFIAERLADEELVVVASPRSSVPDEIDVLALADLPAVCPPGDVAIRRLQDALLHRLGVHGRPVALEMGSAEAIKHAVMADVGIAVLSKRAVLAEVGRKELRLIRVRDAEMSQTIICARLRDRQFTPIQLALLDAIRTDLSTVDATPLSSAAG